MSRAALWGASVVATATALTDVREARACTPPWGGVSERIVLPGDGASAVPRNARILVTYDNWTSSTLELRIQGGATVATTTTMPRGKGSQRLLTPDALLEASTTYEILDTLALPCESEDISGCIGEPAVIATFITGAGVDTTAPVLGDVTHETRGSCIVESCPEGQNETVEAISIGDVDDAIPGWVLYEYLSMDGEVLAGPTSWLQTGRGCDGPGYVSFHIFISLPPQFQIRGVDIAGNVEVAPHAIVGRTCAEVDSACDAAVDAGAVDADPSADEADASNAADDASDGGCGCASSRGAPGTLPLALAALLLAFRRRRTIG